mgnify:CR=1 FL=1
MRIEVGVGSGVGGLGVGGVAMRRIHLPDPLFEQRLEECGGGGVLGALPAGIAERVEDLSVLSGLLAGVGDVVLVDCCLRESELPEVLRGVRFVSESEFCGWFGGLTVGERQGWRLEPWGWSEHAVGLVKRLGLTQGVPDPAVVRVVNSREFSAVEDVLLGVGEGDGVGVGVGVGEGEGGEKGTCMRSAASKAPQTRLIPSTVPCLTCAKPRSATASRRGRS